jgi:hypothetical protein
MLKLILFRGTAMRALTGLLFLLIGLNTYAKTLIVSDIDDTIKVSHILSVTAKFQKALDVTVPFTGMAQLYTLIINDDQMHTRIVYLSNAPKAIAGIPVLAASHRTFLALNNFPEGELNLREDIMDPNHKITELRRLLSEERPDQVILFGDNGERDTEIYHQIQSEFKDIKIKTYIHQLYSDKTAALLPKLFSEKGKSVFPEQIGYVTPIEVAEDLKESALLSTKGYNWMIQNVAPVIVAEPKKAIQEFKSVTFPNFIKCRDFVWRWPLTSELKPVYNKIKERCQ